MDDEYRYEYRECDGCTCCSQAGCNRGPKSECWDDVSGSSCPCTGG